MNRKVTLVWVVVLLITSLFFYVKRETYLDFNTTREAAIDIVNKAGENKGFTESHIKKLKDTLGPVMHHEEKIFAAVIKYAKRDRFQEVIDLIELYFATLRPSIK